MGKSRWHVIAALLFTVLIVTMDTKRHWKKEIRKAKKSLKSEEGWQPVSRSSKQSKSFDDDGGEFIANNKLRPESYTSKNALSNSHKANSTPAPTPHHEVVHAPAHKPQGEHDAGFPTFESLIGTANIENGKEYTIFGCKVKVSKDNCNFSFAPQDEEDEKCRENLSLMLLHNKIFPDAKLNDVMKKYLPIAIYSVDKFSADKCSGEILFDATAREQFDIVQNKLKVNEGTLKLEFNYKKITLEKLGLEISGTVAVGDKNLDLAFIKKKGSKEGKFSIKVDELKVSDFSNMMSSSPIDEESGKDDSPTASKLDPFLNAVIKDPEISGVLDTNNFFELVLNGAMTGVEGFNKLTGFVIAQKIPDNPTTVGIVIAMDEMNPADVLGSLLHTDLQHVPFISDFKVDLVLEAANHDLLIVKDEDLTEVLSKVLANGKMLGKGFKLTCTIPLREIFKKADESLNVDDIPENVGFQIVVKDGKMHVQFSDDPAPEFDLQKFAVAIGNLVSSAEFKSLLQKIPLISLKTFEVDFKTKAIDIALMTKEPIVIGQNIATLHHGEFHLAHREGESWRFTISADQTVGKSTVKFFIAKAGTAYKMSATIRDLTVNSLFQYFGGTNPASDILNFGIRNLEFSADIDKERTDMDIAGNPVLFDWEGLQMHGRVMHEEKHKNIAFTVLMENIDLNTFLGKLLNKEFHQLAWLSGLNIFLCISTADDVEMSIGNKILTLEKGVSIATDFTIPIDCKGDAFCDVLKDKLKPGTVFSLSGTISPTGFQIEAAYEHGEFQLAENMIFEGAAIVLSSGLEGNSIALSGKIKMEHPLRRFEAKLAIDITGKVGLTLTMKGMWRNPFDIHNLQLGNVRLGAAVQPAIGLQELEMSSAVTIGKLDTKDVISSNMAGGFDILRPDLSYFYIELNDITVSRILKAFQQDKIELLKSVQDSGFPEGLVVAYTGNPKGKRIDYMDINIDFGIAYRGKINILGQTFMCELKIGTPFDLKIEADMSPVTLGNGAVVLKKSEKDFCNGPHMYIRISAGEIAFKINGYVGIFGISAEVDVDVSDKGFEFFVHGKIFDVVSAQVKISAPYGDGDIANSQYTAEACLSTSLIEASHAANSELKEAKEKTESALSEAEEKLHDAQIIYSQSTAVRWMDSLHHRQEDLNQRAQEIKETRKFLDNPCVKQCDEVWMPGPSIKQNCFKIFGTSFPCPTWDERKIKTTDPICLAACKGKKVFEQGKAFVEQKTLNTLVDGIEALKNIVEYSKTMAKAGKKFMEFSVEAARRVEEAAEIGKKIISEIAKYARENLIEVKHLCFNTLLSAVKNNCFDFDVSVIFAGEKHIEFKRNACFDSGFMKRIGGLISNEIFPGVDKLKDKLARAKEELKNIDERKIDLQKVREEALAKQGILEGEIPEIPPSAFGNPKEGRRKDAIWGSLPKSKQWAYIRAEMYDTISPVAIKDDVTMEAINTRSPWVLSEHDSPFSWKVINEIEEATEKEKIENFDDFDNCSSPYALVTDSMKMVAGKFVEEMESFNKAAEARRAMVDRVEEDIKRFSVEGNFDEDKFDDAMYYVRKVKNGTARWIANVRSQLAQQDNGLVKMFKKDIGHVIKKKYGMSLSEYLNSRREEHAKKTIVPRHKAAMDEIDQITKEILYHDNTPLTSKLPLFERLEQVTATVGNVC